jgi:hypothetical protein
LPHNTYIYIYYVYVLLLLFAVPRFPFNRYIISYSLARPFTNAHNPRRAFTTRTTFVYS